MLQGLQFVSHGVDFIPTRIGGPVYLLFWLPRYIPCWRNCALRCIGWKTSNSIYIPFACITPQLFALVGLTPVMDYFMAKCSKRLGHLSGLKAISFSSHSTEVGRHSCLGEIATTDIKQQRQKSSSNNRPQDAHRKAHCNGLGVLEAMNVGF